MFFFAFLLIFKLCWSFIITSFGNWTQRICLKAPLLLNISFLGFYAYIETSWPRLNREKARLLTPRLSSREINGNCLQFRYHMYGLNVRSLNVYAQEQSGAETMLWSLTGEKGKLWSAASVPLLIPDKKVLRVRCN